MNDSFGMWTDTQVRVAEWLKKNMKEYVRVAPKIVVAYLDYSFCFGAAGC